MYKVVFALIVIWTSDLYASSGFMGWLSDNLFPAKYSTVGLTKAEELAVEQMPEGLHSAYHIKLLHEAEAQVVEALERNDLDSFKESLRKKWLMQTALTPVEYRERKFRLPEKYKCKICPSIPLDDFYELVGDEIVERDFARRGYVRLLGEPSPKRLIINHFKDPMPPVVAAVFRFALSDMGGDPLDHFTSVSRGEFEEYASDLYRNRVEGAQRCWILPK